MVCLRSPVTSYHQARGERRLWTLVHNQILSTSKTLFAKLRDDVFVEQPKHSATCWTSVSVSPLIPKG